MNEGWTAERDTSKLYEERKLTHKSGNQFQFIEAGYQVKSKSPEWDSVLETMAAEIKVRHYSRKTLKTYANWSRQFQRFLKDKPPQELTSDDVKEYLKFLAVKMQCSGVHAKPSLQLTLVSLSSWPEA